MSAHKKQPKPSKEIDLNHAFLLEIVEDFGQPVGLSPMLLQHADLTQLPLRSTSTHWHTAVGRPRMRFA